MSGKKVKRIIILMAIIFIASTTLRFIGPALAAGGAMERPSLRAPEAIEQELDNLIPSSIKMVDQAIATLSKGWAGMNENEREAFLTLYDPSGSGDVDEAFLAETLANYEKIRKTLEEDMVVRFEPEGEMCSGKRLYYTDLLSLHVCAYFLTEDDTVRKARTLVHEVAHQALTVRDRPYYRPTSKAYAELTPRGSWIAQLPLVGPVIREIVLSDTLYHPDAYAHFGVAVSNYPGEAAAFGYYDAAQTTPAAVSVTQDQGDVVAAVDSWSR